MATRFMITAEDVSFSVNPIVFRLHGNSFLGSKGAVFSGYLAEHHLTFDGSKITFQFGDETVTMSQSYNPDDSGYQYHFKGQNGSLLSATELAPYFVANDILNKYYQITSKDNHIVFTARKMGTFYNWKPNSNLVISSWGVDKQGQNNYKLLFEVFFRKSGGTEFENIYSEKLNEDEPLTGIATIDIGRILDAHLSHDLPFFDPTGTKLSEKSTRGKGEYFCRFAEVYGDRPKTMKYNDSATKHVIKGGLSYISVIMKKKLLDSLQLDINDHKKDRFLKQGPRLILVRVDQPEYLSFVNTRADNTSLRLDIKIVYTDESTSFMSLSNINNVSQYDKYNFNVGCEALGLQKLNPSKTIQEYICSLSNQKKKIISESITFRLDYQYRDQVRYFLYTASVGSIDTLVACGLGSEEYELSFQTVVKSQQIGYVADSRLDPTAIHYDLRNGNENYHLSLQRTFTVSTGWLNKNQFDQLADFFLAEKKWIITNGIPIPITVTSKKAGEHHDQKSLIAQKFEYKYDFVDKKYTENTQFYPLIQQKKLIKIQLTQFVPRVRDLDGFFDKENIVDESLSFVDNIAIGAGVFTGTDRLQSMENGTYYDRVNDPKIIRPFIVKNGSVEHKYNWKND